MDAIKLIDAISKKLGTNSQVELANALGVSVQTLINWKTRGENLSPLQVASALVKAQSCAVEQAHYHMIKPIVEFFEVDWVQSTSGAKWKIFPSDKSAPPFNQGLKKALDDANGIYIFYDSRGRAIYVGKARDQSLWKEMNLAYNRDRGELQTITRVHHPSGEFFPAYERPLQPKTVHVELHELAYYFSAYAVTVDMIDDIEALLIRGFVNDLLNKKIERFAHSKI
jgi:DNA-binding XRE family transcriptional regulator